jgi:alpha-L-fucosidase
MLVKIVSRGGNFLLNVGPNGQGELDDDAYVRLREIGDWMQVNSEGIYGTRPVKPYQEGPVYYTSKGDYVYAFYIPEEGDEVLPGQVKLGAFVPVSSRAVTLMGSKRQLKWKRTEEGVVVDVPASLRAKLPCEHIWGFKIKVK